MSPYTPSGYGFTPTPHTMGYDISGPTDYVDSTTFDPRQTPIDPLPDSNNLVSTVVSTGKCHPHRIKCLFFDRLMRRHLAASSAARQVSENAKKFRPIPLDFFKKY
jgi:hypothetical protein